MESPARKSSSVMTPLIDGNPNAPPALLKLEIEFAEVEELTVGDVNEA
jgi:hypothetical protein